MVRIQRYVTDLRRLRRNDGLKLALVGIGYLFAHRLAFLFPDTSKVLMAIWPAGGIGLAALLLCSRRLWPAILATIFTTECLADLFAGLPVLSSLGFSTADVLESLTCAWLLTKWCGEGIRFTRTREIAALVSAASVLNAGTALLGAAAAELTHAESLFDFWRTWGISHGLGILLVAPLIVAWVRAEGFSWGFRPRRVLEWFALMVLWMGGSWIAFERGFGAHANVSPHPYMLVLLLAWGAARFGQRTVALALVILTVIAVSSRAVTVGPLVWSGQSFTIRLLQVQMFVGVSSILAYLLTASLTETRLSLRALRDSENSYRTLVEQASEAIFITDEEGKYINVNARACTLVGYAREDLLHMSLNDVIVPEDLAARPVAYPALATGEQVVAERQLRRKDGTVFFAEISGTMLSDRRYQGIVRDISEHKQMQETLRRSEEKYRSLFNNAAVGMFRTRIDGSEILDLNDKYAEILGRTREELLGSASVMYWADRAQRAVAVDRLKADGRVTDFECGMVAKDGRVKRCLTSARLYPEYGILEGSLIDISAWKHAEAERLDLEQQLAQAKRLESLGTLAGGIAHDFNNLMSAIYGHIELAIDGSIDQQVKADLSRAMATMGRARDLTRQLLTFAKGGAPMRKVARLFPLVEESARLALSGGRATCAFDIEPGLWASSFDEKQLDQVIGNLVINAVQAMPDGGSIRIAARNVKLGTHELAMLPAGDYVSISVEDTGMGISPEILPRIFDPFFTTKEHGRDSAFPPAIPSCGGTTGPSPPTRGSAKEVRFICIYPRSPPPATSGVGTESSANIVAPAGSW
jgi:PAS domain S-box-containing protein